MVRHPTLASRGIQPALKFFDRVFGSFILQGEWIYPDEKLLLQAGRLKNVYRLSVADALIAAVAKLHDATLVHKDPRLEALWDLIGLMSLSLKAATRDMGGRDVD